MTIQLDRVIGNVKTAQGPTLDRTDLTLEKAIADASGWTMLTGTNVTHSGEVVWIVRFNQNINQLNGGTVTLYTPKYLSSAQNGRQSNADPEWSKYLCIRAYNPTNDPLQLYTAATTGLRVDSVTILKL